MTWYIYPPMVALDQSGNPVSSASGQIYADTDELGATPLAIRDLNANTITSVDINSLYLTQGFQVENAPEVNWRSGEIIVALSSPKGMRLAAEAAQQAAEDALAELTEFLLSNPTEWPVNRFPGGYLAVAPDLSLYWATGSGGGSAGLSDYSQVVSLPGYPVNGFAGASHVHQLTNLRKNGSDTTLLATFVLNMLSASTQQEARTFLGAGAGNGNSDVTVNGASTGAAMPANKQFKSDEIQLISAITGLTASTVHEALVALAARGTGGGAAPDGITITRYYSSGAYPVRGTGIASPPTAVVRWRGPVWPTLGGLYMQVGDEYVATP